MLDEATLDERMRNAPVSKAKRNTMLAAVRQDRAAAKANPVPARAKVLARVAAARDKDSGGTSLRTRTSWWSKNDPGLCTDPYHRTR